MIMMSLSSGRLSATISVRATSALSAILLCPSLVRGPYYFSKIDEEAGSYAFVPIRKGVVFHHKVKQVGCLFFHAGV